MTMNAHTENDTVLDARTSDDSTDLTDILNFTGRIALGTVQGVVSGAATLVTDAARGCVELSRGNVGKAADIIVERGCAVVQGAVTTAESAVEVLQSGANAVLHDKPFITPENEARLTRLTQTALYVAGGCVLSEDAASETETCRSMTDACSLPGVENGRFVGSAEELEALTEAGQIPDTEHLSADEVHRDPKVAEAYREQHGLVGANEYELHHIHPLSEGGADHPDNLVAITPEEHDRITAAHARYYGWNEKTSG